MTTRPALAQLLATDPSDGGCDATFRVIAEYVEVELAGGDAAVWFGRVAAHLRCCPACRIDHDGLLDAARATPYPPKL